MNINTELFKKYKPENKLAIIKKLTDNDIMQIRPSTILRIIKEVGEGDSRKARNKFKTLRLKNSVGNHWNSTIKGISNGKKDTIYLTVYLQGDSTDTVNSFPLLDFLNFKYDSVDCATLEETNGYGYSTTIAARYTTEDRIKVLREILYSYMFYKYNIQ